VAFYSDEGGAAGLWIWTKATRQSVRFPGVTVRPFFGFEAPRWSRDGHHLLCKILPEDLTIAQANRLTPLERTERQFPAHDDRHPGVLVLSAGGSTPPDNGAIFSFMDRSLADLASLDLQTNQVERLVRKARILWYRYSPDQRFIAYSAISGAKPNSQDIRYDLQLIDQASGQSRVLAHDVPLGYGNEVNWAPDSRTLAHIAHDEHDRVSIVVQPIDGAPARHLDQPADVSLEETAPRWSADGTMIYATAKGGHLWALNSHSGAAVEITQPAGIEIQTIIGKFDEPTAWTTDHGTQARAVGLRTEDRSLEILKVDLASHRAAPEMALPLGAVTGDDIDIDVPSGRLACVVGGQHNPGDIWVQDLINHVGRRVGHLNPELDQIRLGDARLIAFKTADGRLLHAALLLPPDYRPGKPLPMVVWVYPGENGSDAVHTYGLLGDMPVFDMQILATRGFAVLFPDVPLKGGQPVKDILDAVNPAVDAAISQGYADANRLAVMGQSYGAYAVLSLISHTGRFKAAVATASVIHPDLLASYLEADENGAPRRIGFFEHGQGGMLASPWQDRARYLENSPIYDFDKITTPLLMAQGGNDGRLLGSDATFLALQRLGKDVEYRIYEREDHVLQRRENVRDFWQRRFEFLQKYVGYVSPPQP
jgi:dipeptidyl aminopeptidase/acylaminoacyl peptidase